MSTRTRYKLTDKKLQTFDNTQWELGRWKHVKGDLNKPLCSSNWIHVYSNPELALILNPAHAAFSNPKLFRCEVKGNEKNDKGLKIGVQSCKLVKELDVKVSLVLKISFVILCVKRVYKNKAWCLWADNWLNGSDRSAKAARAAATTVSNVVAADDDAAVAYDVVRATAVSAVAYDVVRADDAADAASVISIFVASATVGAASIAAGKCITLNFIKILAEAKKYVYRKYI